MRLSAKQIFMALASLIATLGVLLVGQRLYRSTVVATPLVAHVGSISGVRWASLTGSTVTVDVKPGANLMAVYQNVVQKATAALGHQPARVVIVSHSDGALNRLDADVQFVVAQGEATGQFVAMKQTIQSLAHRDGAGVTLEIDTHHLYVTLKQHQHVLYDVIPIAIGGVGRG